MLTWKHYSQPGCCCCCVSSSFLYFYSCRSTMMLEMNFQLMLNKLSWLRIFSCLNILGFSFLFLPSSHQSISTCSMFLVTRNNSLQDNGSDKSAVKQGRWEMKPRCEHVRCCFYFFAFLLPCLMFLPLCLDLFEIFKGFQQFSEFKKKSIFLETRI